MKQPYIVSHTSIRGIAALLVVFYHLQFGTEFYLPFESATPFFKLGYLWVDLFFILSGFVISYSMRAEERAPFDRTALKTFAVHRFARIYPLHFIALTIFVVVLFSQHIALEIVHGAAATGPFRSPRQMMALGEQYLLLNAWGLTGLVTWNIPSWSISAEAVAYVVFPLFAAMIVRWRAPTLVVMILLAIVFYAWIGATTGNLDIVKGVAILRCLAGFGLGMVLYALRHHFEPMSGLTLGLLQLVGAALALATLLLGLNNVYAIPGFFLLVAATWTDRGWLSAILKLPVLHWLGEISYSIYLNHLWVVRAWRFVMDRVFKALDLDPTISRTLTLIGCIVIVLIVSHLSYHFIERPARRAIVRRYQPTAAANKTSTLHV